MIDRRLKRAARPLRRLLAAGSSLAEARAIAPVALAITRDHGDWIVESARRARSGIRIVMLRNAGGRVAVLKLADIASAAAQVEREGELLGKLRQRVVEDGLLELVPEPIARGRHGSWTYLLQRALPGVPSTPLLPDPDARRWMVDAASDVARRLHGATTERVDIASDQLQEWVDRPLAQVAQLARGSAEDGRVLETIRHELHAALEHRKVTVAFIHGDFWSENLLWDARTMRITGVVDWDSADPSGLPAHDLLHLVLYSRKLLHGSEIGTEICRAIGGDASWRPEERRVIDSLEVAPANGHVSFRTHVLLYWLRLVTTNLARQPETTRQRRWIADNIDAVVACV
jgi:aminoglycoside phosphotransferase